MTLPRGAQYDFLRYQVNWRTSNRRLVAFDGRYEAGDFYSGTRKEFVNNITFRILPGLIVYTAAEFNSIALPEATFNTRLYRVVPELQFTPFLTWVNNVQYDTVSGVAGWQSRFRWIVRPGNASTSSTRTTGSMIRCWRSSRRKIGGCRRKPCIPIVFRPGFGIWASGFVAARTFQLREILA